MRFLSPLRFLSIAILISIPTVLFAQPANDHCAGAVTVTPSSNCTNTTYNIKNATAASSATPVAPTGACGSATSTTTYDMWFRFQATAANTAITLSNPGNNLSLSTMYLEAFSGACGSLLSIASSPCQNASSRFVISGLTVGTFYYFRVYVTTFPTATGAASKFDYDMCVQALINDDCSGAVNLTAPTTTCNNITGSLDLASATTGLPAGCESVGTHYDAWYRFVAANAMQTVTLGSLGANLNNPEIQLYSGTCGTLISLACGTTSVTATGLTVGATYYVRVSNVGSNPAGTGGVANFNICVTNPPAAPANDNCSGAISLSTAASCSNTTGTLIGATASSGIPAGCASAGTYYDVWYSFTAASTYEVIRLSNLGANVTNARLQLFSGTCGSLTSLQCGTTSIGATGLTIGSTYYVRVSNFNSFVASSGGFSICVSHPAEADIDFSRSYINVSKGNTGGTVNPGDTLEMRMTFVVRSDSADNLSFTDTLFNTRGLRLIPGTIAWRTNEGKIYGNGASAFTDALDSDPGWYYTSGLDTVIRLNFGIGASSASGGVLKNTSRPSVFNGTCIIMATYRVVVYAPFNSTINFKTGSLTYRDGNSSILRTETFAANNLIVYESPGLCPNAVSPTNALGAESNGTFGSGTTQNRAASPFTTYNYMQFNPAGPNDYYYGIANNTSTTGTTINTWAKPNSNRVHNVWDISGDHTGAANPLIGNSPTAIGTNGGYMLVINSSYKTDTAFTYAITSLCPNTYYEISAWFKNICYKCGCDSTGAGTSSGSYIPTAVGDSSGVRPNIAFDVNGIDYYTTGDILYQGLSGGPTGSDAANRWVKKGFTYLTGPAQTSFTLTLRNNAPGGGGNDWALDDIAVATCNPDMTFTPSSTPFVCSGNNLDITGTVTSYFNNYTNYIWQKSIDGGTTWTNETTPAVGSPTVNGSGQYVYSVAHATEVLTTSDDGIMYRLVTATTSSNLSSSSCTLSGSVEVIPDIDACTPVLGINLISFNAQQEGASTILRWSTTKETELLKFTIEGSTNGRDFVTLATMNSNGNSANVLNAYNWSEQYRDSKYYYRIKMTGNDNGTKYSRTIVVDGLARSASFVSIINPFHNALIAEVQIPDAGLVRLHLVDNNGVIVQTQNAMLQQGKNRVSMNNVSRLTAGMYTLKIVTNQTVLSKKVIKQ